ATEHPEFVSSVGPRATRPSKELRSMRIRAVFLVLLCFALLVPLASAQVTGDMSGVVRDKDGTPLPGVLVTITGPNLPKGRSVSSLGDGAFRFTGLIPGTYHLRAELSGLGVFEQDVVVSIQKDTEVRPVLAPSIKEAVTVTAATPVIDTKGTTVAQVTSV